MIKRLLLSASLLFTQNLFSQDTTVFIDQQAVTLTEVVVRNQINVPAFMQRIKEDSSFYKAFKNLRILGYTAMNDIRMLDKKNKTIASLSSTSVQHIDNNCRWMDVLRQAHQGKFYDKAGGYNFYTAEFYANLFFAADTICGETNIVGDPEFSIRGKSGLAKHKEQLKMLFFNPGKRIPGLPFIGNKVALFDEKVADLYDFEIDINTFKGENCYVFSIIPRQDLSAGERKQLVINEMTTWFDMQSWEIAARHYDLSYSAGIYDFDVHIEVEMGKAGPYTVPVVMRYNGDWDIAFKPRERGIFTATLSNFILPRE